MIRHNLVLALITVVLLLAAGFIALYELREPPLARLREAMSCLETARAAQADRWAADSYISAQRNLLDGQHAMARVNAGWWPFESYRVADSLLGESIRFSNLAISQAQSNQANHKIEIETGIARLSDSLEVWRDILDETLPSSEDELLYRSAFFKSQLSINMLKKNQHDAARKYADTLRILLDSLQKSHRQNGSADKLWIRRSQDWLAKTVEKSKASKEKVIIVDKSRHYIYVISDGRVSDSMTCDLGYNSGHQKRVMGDGATPEGMYSVTRINLGSKFYKAMLLNYPNADDRQRFQSNLSTGIIPSNSQIGGLIEIHGHGGTGRDWTDGCVAVTDQDMDRLLKIAVVGTPVTIVRRWEKR